SIRRNDILRTIDVFNWFWHVRAEERNWRLRFNSAPLFRELDGNGHELAIERNVEQFLAVAPPARLSPAISGNHRLRAGAWKRLDIDLKASRFVGLVGDPFSIRRELGVTLLELGLHDWKRLSIAFHRERPDVVLRFQTEGEIQQVPSIGRGVRGH